MRCLLAVLFLIGCGSSGTAAKAPVAAGRYPVPEPVGRIVRDAGAFGAFVAAVRPDLEREAATATDPEIVKERWFVIAMLDGLEGRLDAARVALDRAAALEGTAAAKAMLGLTLRTLADAGAGAGDEGYLAALEARVAGLPVGELGKELSMLRTMAQQFSPEVCEQLVDGAVGPQVQGGTVGMDQVGTIVFQRYAVVILVPRAAVIDAVLAAHGIEPVRE